jgi:aspartate/methionine/tyrosine aminotransferase
MKIKDFSIERYFAKYEFTAKYLLSSSDCDGYSMQSILDMASAEDKESWDQLKLGYTETKGNPFLRELVTQQYSQIHAENILVMSPGEANFCLMNVLLEKGDEVICMAPMYQSLYQVASSIGCEVSFWEPEADSEWYYSPQTLSKLVSAKTKLIIVNFPHNPTGYMPSLADWLAIIEIARKYNITLFSDEMYRSLVQNPADEIPAACDLYENAVSLWGMSKTFGLAGLRIG